jgi:hypothetical protein
MALVKAVNYTLDSIMSLREEDALFYHAADPSPIVEVWLTQSTSDNMCCIHSFRFSFGIGQLIVQPKEIGLPRYPSGVRDRMKHEGRFTKSIVALSPASLAYG